MARVLIPPEMRALTGGLDWVDVAGANVREVIANLDQRFPGLGGRLCDDDGLRPGLAVAVDQSVTGVGLWRKVADDSEIHFLPAIGGG